MIRQAVAARVRADKVAFYNCSFISVQDTLWDDSGRHLYQSCYIKGSVDYIFGAGQSHFEVRIHSLIYKLDTVVQFVLDPSVRTRVCRETPEIKS